MARIFGRLLVSLLLAGIFQAGSMSGSLAAHMNRSEVKLDDPFGCRAIVRAEMGIPRQAGYQFPEFGPRVRKCVVAHGGGGTRPQMTAQRGVQQPAEGQSKKSNTGRANEPRTKIADRGKASAVQSRPVTAAAPEIAPTSNSVPSLGKRVALVIGNGAYEHVPTLSNPPNDATDIATALRRLGFAVVLANNLSFQRTKDAVAQFEQDVIDSDISVIYYAGHGIEAYGENWMIPIDARARRDGDLSAEAVNLKTLSADVAKSKSLGLIILDACRDNPFTPARAQNVAINSSDAGSDIGQLSRSVKRGLAPTEPSGNVLIAFAAKDGTTANDGDGRNSPFTTALLRHIETPGLEVNFLFRRVRDDVMSATKGIQQPYVYGSLSRTEVFLKPTSSVGEASPKP